MSVKNKSYLVIFMLLVFVRKSTYAQSEFKTDTMLLKGKYFGKNIYVQNPRLIKGQDTIYTAQQVLVNDSLVLNYTQLQKSAFAIPLTKMHLKEDDVITIKIVQWNFGRVKILNQIK